jgi:transcriptional regulator with XRE-family HTH domain
MAQRPDPQNALGEVIRERREQTEQSQEQVGLAADSSQAQISRIEKGENPSYGLAGRIARALGWSHPELVQRVEAREAAGAPIEGPGGRRTDGRAARGR